MPRPLEGIKVIDLSHALAGPYCSMLLADLGADVVKVEPPVVGDQARQTMGSKGQGDDSFGFLAVNRNKKSIVLDLKSSGGQRAFAHLLRLSDVLIENFRPGVTRRLGIDYKSLKDEHPHIIYASISGFGQSGPLSHRAGYDLIAQGMSGIMSVTGEPGRPPVKCGVPISDLSSALFAAIGILSAYIERQQSGLGQHIDVSLFNSGLALSVWETAELWSTSQDPRPMGSAHRLSAPYQALRTADGYITVGANNQRLWKDFCDAIGRSDLYQDPRFETNEQRLANLVHLVAELEDALLECPTDHWVAVLDKAGVAAGPIWGYAESTTSDQASFAQMVVEIDHPIEGTIRQLGIPIKLSRTPGSIQSPPPLLGSDTDRILQAIGYSAAEIDELKNE